MAEFLSIHPDNPQPRLIRRAVEHLRAGAVMAYPTDSCYALGSILDHKAAAERISRIRQFDKNHLFTLVCRDLSEIARYARVDNRQYRALKASTPGPYTFILRATKQAPRRLLGSLEDEGERPRRHGLEQPVLGVINARVGRQIRQVAADQREQVVLVELANAPQPFGRRLIAEVTAQRIAGIGGIDDHRPATYLIRHLIDQPRLWVVWMNFKKTGHGAL